MLEGPPDRSIEGAGGGCEPIQGGGGPAGGVVDDLRALGVDDAEQLVARYGEHCAWVALETYRRLIPKGFEVDDPKGFVIGVLKKRPTAPPTPDQVDQRVEWQRRKKGAAQGKQDERRERLDAAWERL